MKIVDPSMGKISKDYFNNFFMRNENLINKRTIIVVSGTAGSGKSTFMEKLSDEFDEVAILRFDDYFSFLRGWPKDIRIWLDEGADIASIKNERMIDDIKSLKNGHHIIYPNNQETIHPTKLILVEDPSGKERKELAELADFVVFIDTPNDIALRRILSRWINKEVIDDNGNNIKLKEQNPRKLLDEIITYLENYLDYFRNLYVTICERTKKNSDIILDGTKAPEEIVNDFLLFLEKRTKKD